MLFPQENIDKWVEKYGLRVQSGECSMCGKQVVTDIPFVFEGYRGLKSKDHGCGEKYTWKTFKPFKEKEKAEWRVILDASKDN